MSVSVILIDEVKAGRTSVSEAFLVAYGFEVVVAQSVTDVMRLVHGEPYDVAIIPTTAGGDGDLVARALRGTLGGDDLGIVCLEQRLNEGFTCEDADAILPAFASGEMLRSVVLIVAQERGQTSLSGMGNDVVQVDAAHPVAEMFCRAQSENLYELLGAEPDESAPRLREKADAFLATFNPEALAGLPDGPLRVLGSAMCGTAAELAFVFSSEKRRAQYDLSLVSPHA